MPIQNIKVSQHPSSGLIIEWDDGKANYHVLYVMGQCQEPMFKNPLVNSGEPGFFKTRKLKLNPRTITKVMKEVEDNDLIMKAILSHDDAPLAQKIKYFSNEIKLDNPNPQLVEALQLMIAAANKAIAENRANKYDFNKALDKAREALSEAGVRLSELETT